MCSYFSLITLSDLIPVACIGFPWDLLDLRWLFYLFWFFPLTWTRRLRQIKEFHESFIFYQMWFQVPPSFTPPTDRRWESSLAGIVYWAVLGKIVDSTHGGFVCSLQLEPFYKDLSSNRKGAIQRFSKLSLGQGLRTHKLDLVCRDYHLLW